MGTVYITLSNAKNIVMGKTKLKGLNLTGSLYKRPIYFFSKFERVELLAFQELLKNPERYFNTFYEPLNRKDTYTMVREALHPAYHCDPECIKLRADYENLKIPKLIKEEFGVDGVKEVRNLFQENPDLYLRNPDQFLVRLYNKYSYNEKVKEELEHILQTNSAKSYLIELPNGGIGRTQSLTVKEAEDSIDKLLDSYLLFLRANEKNHEILTKYAQWTYQVARDGKISSNTTRYSDEDVSEVIKEFDYQYKRPLIGLLCQYYQITTNENLSFKSNFLDSIGFKACGTCYGTEVANLNFFMHPIDSQPSAPDDDLPF